MENDNLIENISDSSNNEQSKNIQEENNSFNWSDYIKTDEGKELDKRFGSMWKSPKDLYDSYHNIEKAYQKNQGSLKETQDKMQELNRIAEEYNQLNTAIKNIENDPVFSERFREMLADYTGEIKKQKYGTSEISDEIVQKLAKFDEFMNQQEETKQLNELTEQWKSEFSFMQEWSKKYGSEFDPQDFKEFCIKNNILDPKEARFKFIELATPQIIEASRLKAQENTVKNIQKNKFSNAISSNGINKNNDNSLSMNLTDYIKSKI